MINYILCVLNRNSCVVDRMFIFVDLEKILENFGLFLVLLRLDFKFIMLLMKININIVVMVVIVYWKLIKDNNVLFKKNLVFFKVFFDFVRIVIYLNNVFCVFFGIRVLMVFLVFILLRFFVMFDRVCVVII